MSETTSFFVSTMTGKVCWSASKVLDAIRSEIGFVELHHQRRLPLCLLQFHFLLLSPNTQRGRGVARPEKCSAQVTIHDTRESQRNEFKQTFLKISISDIFSSIYFFLFFSEGKAGFSVSLPPLFFSFSLLLLRDKDVREIEVYRNQQVRAYGVSCRMEGGEI